MGNIGALQNPEIFLKTMMSLSRDNMSEFQFLFIGDGIMLNHLKEKTARLNLKNITFVGRIKREYVPAYMNLSDILVANYLSNKYMDICIPGKLFEYAISRRPIVMGARGEAKYLIDKYSLGLTVAPSDVNGFTKAIQQISNESYEYNPKLKQFVSDFSLKNVSKLYDSVFEKIEKRVIL